MVAAPVGVAVVRSVPFAIRNRANVGPATVWEMIPGHVSVTDEPSAVPAGTGAETPSLASKTPFRLKSTQPTRVAFVPGALFATSTDTE